MHGFKSAIFVNFVPFSEKMNFVSFSIITLWFSVLQFQLSSMNAFYQNGLRIDPNYVIVSKQIGRFFQIFVAFSEYMNFISLFL